MARMSADIDTKILDEAQQVSGCRTKRETIDRALREFVARARARELASLAGKDLVEMSVEDLAKWRSSSKTGKS